MTRAIWHTELLMSSMYISQANGIIKEKLDAWMDAGDKSDSLEKKSCLVWRSTEQWAKDILQHVCEGTVPEDWEKVLPTTTFPMFVGSP